ncbi:tetratricopeptide repeat protein [Sphaerospermopsis sp. FACHB-1094]|uniref:tetratricopeptide repeat protein n=1 Tax=Sphaerospermopsis sp. FACHB-1094 TaxID=2692861 RepID=UPI0016883BBA|nr:tetratricopeptide repeat protein [Sphaerospermopsis sp. FACHB-1094]MBD2135843.1 tetratricopeptide repeat protein [Sphaerospermopsis sp. FACHB-1094]
MDWITLLRSLQSDFIKRLNSGCLLHCETPGNHSELTIISGERLTILRNFCWLMAEKYKRTSPVRNVFISNLKGKLGEEVVKERLADLITEVDYEKRMGGDGRHDFTLTKNPEIRIQVKSRHGTIEQVRWSVSAEEVEKNTVIVCILIKQEVNEAQSEYHLFLAGFLPTTMIKLKTGKISFGIHQLLYGGGLLSYLENFPTAIDNDHIDSQNPQIFYEQKKIIKEIESQDDFLDNNDDIIDYKHRGNIRYELGEYEGAIEDYNQAIKINANDEDIYYDRGNAHFDLGNYEAAINDFSKVIKIKPNYTDAYYHRGNARLIIGDKQGAIEDFQKAADLYWQNGKIEEHKDTQAMILDLEIEESLDILNF